MANPIRSYSALVNGKTWIVDGAFQFDFDAPAGSVQEVMQNVFNIIQTPLGTQVLLRLFGSDQNWIDAPGNVQMMQARTAFLLSLNMWEPRAKVTKIKFSLDPTSVMAGVYTLYFELNIDLKATLIPTLVVLPPSNEPVWVIDGPIGGELGVSEELLTV
jgi:phage baseplate assembly protein W